MVKKNILFLMGTYPSYGGVETVSTTLANRFIEDGHQVTIASYMQPQQDGSLLNLSEKCYLLFLSCPVLSLKNIKRLRSYIISHQIDVLINQWVVPFYASWVWKLAIRGTNCQVYSVHHNPPDTNMHIQALKKKIDEGKGYLRGLYWLVREISRLSLAYCINHSHKFIVLSPSFVPVAKQFSRVSKEDKFLAIPNPNTISASDDVLTKEKEILYVGRIEYNQKRTDRVIEVWKELEHIYPDWKLTIVGDGDDRENLQKRIDEYGLKHVEITGFVNPKEYYKRALILLLTSEYEGFGLVIVEAMSYGVVPVVYNSFKTASDLISNRYNGVLVGKPFETQKFKKVIQDLMDDADYWNTMSNNGRVSSEEFSLEYVVKEWYNIIGVL